MRMARDDDNVTEDSWSEWSIVEDGEGDDDDVEHCRDTANARATCDRNAAYATENVGSVCDDSDEEGFWEMCEFCSPVDTEAECMQCAIEDSEGGDAGRRRDEAEVMAAMYGSDFILISPREWVLHYNIAKGVLGQMHMRLPVDYPSCSAPVLALDIPNCTDLKKVKAGFLESFVPDNEVAFIWAERFMELCRESAEELQELMSQRREERSVRLNHARGQRELLWEQWPQPQVRRSRWRLPSEQALAVPSTAEVAARNQQRQRELEAREKLERELHASWKASAASVPRRPRRNPLCP